MVKLTRNNNASQVRIGSIIIYFSYETPIAFYNGETVVARQNDWGNTTGKHLNLVSPFKDKRISGDEFEKRLQDLVRCVEKVK